MRDCWLVYLALGALTLFIIWRARRTTSQLAPEAVPQKAPRVLKPRTPEDCPLCRRPHPTPWLGKVCKPGIKPWPARTSRRGPAKRVCTAGYACPNPACDYHGNTDATFHALVGNGLRNDIQQFKCQACQTRFSSRLGTALYRLRTPARAIGQALLAFNLGLSAAEVQLLVGHSDTTLRLWRTRAGLQAQRVHQHFFRNLHLGHLQFDELYTTLRDKTHDVWIWVAFDPKTKLIPAVRLGPRTQDVAHALVHAVGQVLAPGCVPGCTSDGLNLYFYALTAHFGAWVTDPATGKLSWQVALMLLYGQVKKSYRRRKMVKVERRMQLGQLADLQAALHGLGFTGSINTAFVERINLTLRHALAALTRRTWATAQLTPELEVHLEWWRAYYHFCRPHQGLRMKLVNPQARRGRQTPRCYQPCTPAMAAGFTNRVWRLEELLAFPIG